MITKNISVGLDAGMGAVKLFSRDGSVEMLSQVSINGSGHLDSMVGLVSAKRPLCVKTVDGEFYTGANAHDFGRAIGRNLNFDRLNGTPEMRALVYAAFTQYIKAHGAFDAPLSMMVGLSLATMTEEMKEYRSAMRKWLTGLHDWSCDGQTYSVNIESVRTNSQPVGALFNFVLNDDCTISNEHKGALTSEVGVLSIGFKTLEFMVIENSKVKEGLTIAHNLGVHRLLELVKQAKTYSLGELDMMARANDKRVREKLNLWASEVNGAIDEVWGKVLPRFEAVLVVGGGAMLLGNLLKLQGKQILDQNPVMSIARGLYLLNIAKPAK
jgi:hypothetical protein